MELSESDKKKFKQLTKWYTPIGLENVELKIQRYINIIILVFYYFLMLVSLLFSIWGILSDLGSLVGEKPKNEINDIRFLLKFVEHIFLFVLPFIIIKGFYNYYYYTLHIILSGNIASDQDHEKAMSSINNSKLILLSSLLTFLLIQIIGGLFYENEIDNFRLAISLALSIILMIYIVFQQRIKH